METPQRKQNRLSEYDYGQAGAYFVTLCTQNRARLFQTELPGVGNGERHDTQVVPYGTVPTKNVGNGRRNDTQVVPYDAISKKGNDTQVVPYIYAAASNIFSIKMP